MEGRKEIDHAKKIDSNTYLDECSGKIHAHAYTPHHTHSIIYSTRTAILIHIINCICLISFLSSVVVVIVDSCCLFFVISSLLFASAAYNDRFSSLLHMNVI